MAYSAYLRRREHQPGMASANPFEGVGGAPPPQGGGDTLLDRLVPLSDVTPQDVYDSGAIGSGPAAAAGFLQDNPDGIGAHAEAGRRHNIRRLFGAGTSYLPTTQGQDALAQLRQDHDANLAQIQEQVSAGTDQARTRAQATEAQLREAGMLNLADQFNRAQRMIAFDTARRGTLGGSRSIERTRRAELDQLAGAGRVATGARSAAQQQYNAEVTPLLQLQQQAARESPFARIGAGLTLQDLQDRASGAGGTFDLQQQLLAADRSYDQQQAQALYGGLASVGAGIREGSK